MAHGKRGHAESWGNFPAKRIPSFVAPQGCGFGPHSPYIKWLRSVAREHRVWLRLGYVFKDSVHPMLKDRAGHKQ